jgi:hypothetical protein
LERGKFFLDLPAIHNDFCFLIRSFTYLNDSFVKTLRFFIAYIFIMDQSC